MLILYLCLWNIMNMSMDGMLVSSGCIGIIEMQLLGNVLCCFVCDIFHLKAEYVRNCDNVG